MDTITALGAKNMSDIKTQNIIFISNEHKTFYSTMLQKIQITDCYHKALFYTLGINVDTRDHVNEIYDFRSRCIKTGCISKGWQTSGSLQVTRLAFNLFTDGVPTTCIEKYKNDEEKQFHECRKYSASDIFCSGYAVYFFEAIGLRYPEYVKWEVLNAKTQIAGNETRY